MAGSIADTRPLGSAVAGRKVFFQFRGHGRSAAPPVRWTYPDLARDLRSVADLYGATRALGVGLGAGALCRLVADNPGRFERLVFLLPAVLNMPHPQPGLERLTTLLEAMQSGDVSAVAEAISLEAPAQVRNTPAGWAYFRQRLDQLMRDGLAPGLLALSEQAPIASQAMLAGVNAPALVIACRGDELHPVRVAEQLAEALPAAELHVYDKPAVIWTERADLRERIAGFLNAAD
jgi:3-oxoadipate enol-lactonase